MFVSNAVIGLREGLEASLVVVILVAFLVKTGRRGALRHVWLGVGVAVGLSAALGSALTFGTRELPEDAQEIVGGVTSLVAVVLVTGMVLWMRRAGRQLSGDLTGRLGRALDLGPIPVAAVAFLGVGREGLESALFFFATVQSTGDTGPAPVLGWVVGLAAAAALGVAIYQGALRIDMRRFFRWTGIILVVVAAGILAYAVHELQEADVLPGEDALAFDLTGSIDPHSWLASVVRGLVNLRPAMSVLEVGAWAAYLAVVLVLFLRPLPSAAAVTAPRPAVERDEAR